MREFYKWFLGIGYKKYTLGYLIIIAVDYGFFSNYENIWTDSGDGPSPFHLLLVLLAHLVIIAFNYGITYHMITAFKLQRGSKKN